MEGNHWRNEPTKNIESLPRPKLTLRITFICNAPKQRRADTSILKNTFKAKAEEELGFETRGTSDCGSQWIIPMGASSSILPPHAIETTVTVARSTNSTTFARTVGERRIRLQEKCKKFEGDVNEGTKQGVLDDLNIWCKSDINF